jgi:outer membrane protein assembly factor BamB
MARASSKDGFVVLVTIPRKLRGQHSTWGFLDRPGDRREGGRVRRIFVVGAVVLALSGCWPTPGAGPDRRSFNPFERTLTTATVDRLAEAFRVPLVDGAGPPVVTPAGLFVRSGLSIAAFEARTGDARWTVRPTGYGEVFQVSDPYLIAGGDQVLASASTRAGLYYDSEFVVIDARTGTSVPRTPAGRLGSVRGDGAAVVDEVFDHGDTYRTIGVRSLTGGVEWGGYLLEGSLGALTLGEGRLFVATGDGVQAYDTTTPCPPFYEDEPLLVCWTEWTRPVGLATTPVVIGDDATVYVGTGAPVGYEGALLALDAESGGVRFSVAVGAVNRPPALADGVLHIATTDGRLSAAPANGCGAHVCRTTWTTATASEITAQPAVAGGVVYVGSADGTVRAFDAGGCGAATCEPLWAVDAGGPVTGGLAVYGGMLYVGTADALVAYGLTA